MVGLTLVSFCRYRLRRVKGLGQEMIAKGMVRLVQGCLGFAGPTYHVRVVYVLEFLFNMKS